MANVDHRAHATGGKQPKECKPERPQHEGSEVGDVRVLLEPLAVPAPRLLLGLGSRPSDGSLVPRGREDARSQIGTVSRLRPSPPVPPRRKDDRRYNEQRKA
jgi:hypothetical protein